MIDKVISGLECCVSPTPSTCRKCPYKHTPDCFPKCTIELCTDALAVISGRRILFAPTKEPAQLVPRELLLNTWGHGWTESHLIGDDEEPEAFLLVECVWINGHIMTQDGSRADAAGHYWEEHYGKRYGVRVWTGDEKPTQEQREAAPWTE